MTRAVLVMLLALASVAPASAQDMAAPPDTELQWHDEWRRFDAPEYAIAGGLFLLSGLARLTLGVCDTANFRGGVDFVDEPVRLTLRAESPAGRERADFWSDLLWHGTQAFPVVVDVALVAWLLHDSFDTAWQMLWMDIEAFAVVGLIVEASHLYVGRERPSGHDCDEDEGYDPICRSIGRYASFFSGHTAMSFTAAGLTCAHHLNQPLYGDRTADVAACVGTIATATTTAILRMVADRHYFSDVVISAVLGMSAGFLLPTLLHYQAGGQG